MKDFAFFIYILIAPLAFAKSGGGGGASGVWEEAGTAVVWQQRADCGFPGLPWNSTCTIEGIETTISLPLTWSHLPVEVNVIRDNELIYGIFVK